MLGRAEVVGKTGRVTTFPMGCLCQRPTHTYYHLMMCTSWSEHYMTTQTTNHWLELVQMLDTQFGKLTKVLLKKFLLWLTWEVWEENCGFCPHHLNQKHLLDVPLKGGMITASKTCSCYDILLCMCFLNKTPTLKWWPAPMTTKCNESTSETIIRISLDKDKFEHWYLL